MDKHKMSGLTVKGQDEGGREGDTAEQERDISLFLMMLCKALQREASVWVAIPL